ncbi:MAG: TrkA family potassium uptake protein [Chloroflexota bacterium]
MKTVIVGCGRVGAVLADTLDRAGHEVIVVDTSTAAFDRLPASFGGNAVRGDGTDEGVLRRAGAADADLFLALTEGDNRNVIMAQLATEELGARRIVAKVNDPVRAAAYADLGLATICRTTLMADAIAGFLGLPMSGMPSVLPPGDLHHARAHRASDDAPVPPDAAAPQEA